MNLTDYINENGIFFIDKNKKFPVLDELIQKAHELGKIPDKVKFKKAIEKREIVMSTGIGMGIAIPHAKISGINKFFVIAGILKEPIDWDSIDNKPVKAVFLIGGPPDQQNQYLKLISQIIVNVKNDIKREALFKAGNVQDIIQLIL